MPLYMLYCTLLPPAEILRTLPISSVIAAGITCLFGRSAPQSRLGLPIGLHSGLAWDYYIINVGSWWNILVKFLTGLLALIACWRHGLLFLGLIAF